MANEIKKADGQKTIQERIEEKKAANAKKTNPEVDADSIHVKIYSPFKIYFSGPATSVSAENDTGPFDVLPKHHHFMTILNPGDITVRNEGKDQKYRIARGVMHVRDNKVTIFLDV